MIGGKREEVLDARVAELTLELRNPSTGEIGGREQPVENERSDFRLILV